MPEVGPMPTPEMGPRIAPPAPEVAPQPPEAKIEVNIGNKTEKSPQRPPEVEEKYKVEDVGNRKESEENEMHKAREKINEAFSKDKKERTGRTDSPKNTGGNYYETLDVSQDASPEEIASAYRELAKETHPDVGGDAEKFKRINKAFENLSNQDKRAQYDIKLEQKPEKPREYQQGNAYEQGDRTIHSLWGNSTENAIQEQAMDLIRERERNLAVEKRWSQLKEEEQEKYNGDISIFEAELEKKRMKLERKLHLGEVPESVFYHMCEIGYKPEDCRRYGFFVEKIEVPFLDGRKSFKISPGKFNIWMRKIENLIKDRDRKKADVIADKIRKNKARR
ncbi:MAG: DnaJ domain-containing protein [Patescibacteria group bacterium]|mgnify:FL=1